MAKRGDFLREEVDTKRISGLSNLQSMILKHALKMPNLKRLGNFLNFQISFNHSCKLLFLNI